MGVSDSLRASIDQALQAKRIVGKSQSYATDNPTEYRAVRAYLEGGARPNAATALGKHLVLLEDARRELAAGVPTPRGLPPKATRGTQQPVTAESESQTHNYYAGRGT